MRVPAGANVLVLACVLAGTACDSRVEHPKRRQLQASAADGVVSALRSRFPHTVPPPAAQSFFRVGNLVRAQLPDATPLQAKHRAEVALPASADGAFALRDADSGVAVEVALDGARAVAAKAGGGYIAYPDAVQGGTVVHRVAADGTEDLVAFDQAPLAPELRYTLTLGSTVAGLRLVDNELEFLDADGTPRLRVSPPYVVDSSGAREPARLSVERCAYSVDPRPPWRRAVTPPAARHCALRMAWNGGGLRYPILVDPVWKTTGSMAVPRQRHTATRLPSGHVLVAGGSSNANGTPLLASSELYDPGTGTWAATGSMPKGRYAFTATLVGSSVLVTGCVAFLGCASGSTELYTESSGTWTAGPAMTTEHGQYATATRLASGKVLIAGGSALDKADLYDPIAKTWTAVGSLTTGRSSHSATLLKSGKVLVTGGSGAGAAHLASAELYDPATQLWSPVASMSQARIEAQAALLNSGKVLVIGGTSGAGAALDSTEIYDPTSDTWSPGPDLAAARYEFGSAVLASGRVLAVGGLGAGGPSAELYDPATGQWSSAGDLVVARSTHTTTLLASGKVLVVGGVDASTVLDSAEIYGDSPVGSPCTIPDECSTLFCVDGFCCDQACDATCQACSSAAKGSGADGTCGLAAAGQDPHGDCQDDGSPNCGANGLCDGAGACAKYPVQPGCTPSPCSADVDCTSGFCADGICCQTACAGSCRACTAAKKGSGVDGVCGDVAAGTDPDGECAQDPGYPSSCKSDGFCNGGGACRSYATSGTPCGAVACSAGVLAGSECDGAGSCVAASTPCAPYAACKDATTCASSCVASTECVTTSYCASGACVPKRALGNPCSTDTECSSGFCVDNVCCDTRCDGLCQACTTALKQSGADDGVCADARSGTDPHDQCPDDGVASCDRDGACDGTGQCRIYALGSTCAATACTGEASSGYLMTAHACDGAGTCQSNTEQDCGLYTCSTAACGTSCKDDSDCISSAYCSGGMCVSRKMNGKTCAQPNECQSGICTDGVCCDGVCSGQCEACDVPNAVGKCVAVVGTPHGSRTACSTATVDNPCSEATCDGQTRASCQGFVGSSVTCRSPSCSIGVATFAAVCDAKGHCPAPDTKPCAPYACGTTSCNSACATDSDCAAGSRCQDGKCVSGSTCQTSTTSVDPAGNVTDCSPYVCGSGACKSDCTGSADCVSGYLCDPDSRACTPQDNRAPDSGSGCGCRTTSSPANERGLSACLLALVALARRRRRRPRDAARRRHRTIVRR